MNNSTRYANFFGSKLYDCIAKKWLWKLAVLLMYIHEMFYTIYQGHRGI
jgi:hypothetical protein